MKKQLFMALTIASLTSLKAVTSQDLRNLLESSFEKVSVGSLEIIQLADIVGKTKDVEKKPNDPKVRYGRMQYYFTLVNPDFKYASINPMIKEPKAIDFIRDLAKEDAQWFLANKNTLPGRIEYYGLTRNEAIEAAKAINSSL